MPGTPPWRVRPLRRASYKSGSKCVKTHFVPTVNPLILGALTKTHVNICLTLFKGGGKSFVERTLRQSLPSIVVSVRTAKITDRTIIILAIFG